VQSLHYLHYFNANMAQQYLLLTRDLCFSRSPSEHKVRKHDSLTGISEYLKGKLKVSSAML